MKEKTEFVESIVSDVEWLGAKYDGDIKFASNYFDQMYEAAAVSYTHLGDLTVCQLWIYQQMEINLLFIKIIHLYVMVKYITIQH